MSIFQFTWAHYPSRFGGNQCRSHRIRRLFVSPFSYDDLYPVQPIIVGGCGFRLTQGHTVSAILFLTILGFYTDLRSPASVADTIFGSAFNRLFFKHQSADMS